VRKASAPRWGYTARVSDDWYRSARWDREDREQFEAKLARARVDNRAQYVRLKALALAASKRRRERQAAAELLRRVIDEYPEDKVQVAMAWADLGFFYAQGKQDDLAADAFGRCLHAEAGVSVSSGCELALAELIARAGCRDRYPEAVELLDAARDTGLTFKSERWRWLIARARIAADSGDSASAAVHAAEALALLDDRAPDFPRHPDVGLIEPEPRTVRELRRLTEPQRPRR